MNILNYNHVAYWCDLILWVVSLEDLVIQANQDIEIQCILVIWPHLESGSVIRESTKLSSTSHATYLRTTVGTASRSDKC